jgi:uncharacterized membrane protein YeaQ/YmgE (transglycosylase-associated protein family)
MLEVDTHAHHMTAAPVEGAGMDTKNVVIALLMGLVAGWLASWFPFTGGEGGLVQYLISGVLGSFVGSYVLQKANINLGIRNEIGRDIATATLGAVIVMFIANILT